MTKKFAVARLEEIAFKACYREILSNLLLCPEHSQPHSVSMNSYSSLISQNPFLTSPNVRRFVRSRLNYHLIGIMNDEIRKKFIGEFNENFYSTEQKPDIWVFLDCVLDNSFTELETWVAFPEAEPNEKFVHSICNRSPSIEKLKFNFETVGKSKLLMDKLQPIISSLSTLTHLTSLSLYHLKKRHRGLLNFIGTSCPKLHHLCITGFQILNEDIFALLYGEKLNQFPDKEKIEDKNDIIKLKIMPEVLSPFCFTLQHLQLEELIEEKQKFKKSCEFIILQRFLELEDLKEEKIKKSCRLYSASGALLLRHMPNLRRIDYIGSFSVCSAIKLLHQILKANQNLGSNHTDISVKDREDQTHLRLPSPLMITNSPFSGVLSLTSIDCVNIRDEIMMKAIGRMCPHLKEATFSEWLHTDAITPGQLLFILTTEWPKVECVTLIKVSRSYRQAILLGIGPQLSQLTFVDCELIDLADLVPCMKLKVLRILLSSSLLLPSENPEEKYFPSGPFLPKLNRLESDICLGSRYSHLFEEKDSLTYLDLECCHVGTKASNISNWNEMTKYWQRLHTLRIRLCTGLTMAGTKSLSLQLTKLKELSLPSWMLNSKDERDISYDLMDYFNKGPLKIHLKFESSKSLLVCPYQDRMKFLYYEDSDKEISSRDSDESSNFGEDKGSDVRSNWWGEESDYECSNGFNYGYGYDYDYDSDSDYDFDYP